MSLSSYSDVFGINHARGYDEEILAGDVVCTGANQHPAYEVIAVRGDKVWVRNVDTGADHLAMTERCRKISPAPIRMAAE